MGEKERLARKKPGLSLQSQVHRCRRTDEKIRAVSTLGHLPLKETMDGDASWAAPGAAPTLRGRGAVITAVIFPTGATG